MRLGRYVVLGFDLVFVTVKASAQHLPAGKLEDVSHPAILAGLLWLEGADSSGLLF